MHLEEIPNKKIDNKPELSDSYKEFLDVTSEVRKSEWISGELVIQSPAKKRHLSMSKRLTRLLSAHVDRFELGYVAFEKALINLELGVQNFEPDVVFFSNEKMLKMTPSTSMFEAPDFVIEILSKGTAKIDRGIKFESYQKYGVREYWIIDPKQKLIEQYFLVNEKYKLIDIFDSIDYISSKVITNFTIPVRSLFDTYANLAELDRPVREALTKQYGSIISEKEKEIEESKQELEESKQELEKKENQLIASIKLLKEAGMSLEKIMEATQQTKDFIEQC